MANKQEIRAFCDQETFLDLRKVLFRNGLDLQQFISFIVEKTVTNDSRIIELLQEIKESDLYCNEDSNKKLKTLDAESIYSIIEKEMNPVSD